MDLSNLPMDKIEKLDPETLKRLRRLLKRMQDIEFRDKCSESFLTFVKEVWPAFIEGRHHELMSEAFEKVARGELKRLIINMPPRHTKSEFASFLLPAWFLGQYPEKKVIQTAHTAELAVGFGRKVRNLVALTSTRDCSLGQSYRRTLRLRDAGTHPRVGSISRSA
jgi:hypothetical protein